MKSLVYGCGKRLRFTLSHFDINYNRIDFTDSNSNIWNTEYINGKYILPNSEIITGDYAFCIVGSQEYGNEIYKEAVKLGFDEKQIIPFDYINSLWERWKKGEYHNIWGHIVESIPNISVVKNWYMVGEDAESILKIKDLVFFNVTMTAFDLFETPRIIRIYDVSTEKQIASSEDGDICFEINADEMIVRILVKNAVVGIPWCRLSYEKSGIRMQLESSKLGGQMIGVYKGLQRVPYYDEDYTVIERAADYEGTILDVGANYGQSMYAFHYLSKKSRIVSFEVRPDLYEELLLLKKQIDQDNRIRIINAGVSDKEEKLVWYEPSDPLKSGSFDDNFIKGRKLDTEITEKKMECQPLDRLLETYEDVWFIKMDVEGLEYRALKGAKDIIALNHPLILVEQNDKLQDIKALLNGEYELFYYDLYRDKFVEKRQSRLNYWLIPRKDYRSEVVRKIVAGRMQNTK